MHASPGQTESLVVLVDPSFQLASTCDSVSPGLKENLCLKGYFAISRKKYHTITFKTEEVLLHNIYTKISVSQGNLTDFEVTLKPCEKNLFDPNKCDICTNAHWI